jgi:hypothetical protein
MASVPAPRETTPATKPIGVAFGSFYFTPDVSETTTLTQRQFFDTITRCLRGIDGVSEVRTDLGVLQSDQTVEFEPIKHDPTTRYLGPHLQLAHISFSLTIPEAVQREEDRFARGDISENFRVEMGYGWGVPVSCVAVTGAAVPDPTAASRTVSLYLAKRVEQSAEPVAFGYIAPIFAHADFVLIPDKPLAIDAPFRLKQYRLAGYHKYEYAFNPETVKDPVGLFYAAASTEIDLYFRRGTTHVANTTPGTQLRASLPH